MPSGEVRLLSVLFSVTQRRAICVKGQNKQVPAPPRPLHGARAVGWSVCPCSGPAQQPASFWQDAGQAAVGRRLEEHVVTGQMGT